MHNAVSYEPIGTVLDCDEGSSVAMTAQFAGNIDIYIYIYSKGKLMGYSSKWLA